MDIRLLRSSDLPYMQHANLENLPENYHLKYYMYHALVWPHLSYVAVDAGRPTKAPYEAAHPKIVGYVMAKMEEETTDGVPHGHITSLSVMRTHRRLGIAEKLMRQSQLAMVETYGAHYISLHVRVSNTAAISLYRDTLVFSPVETTLKYYADGEDAFLMRKDLGELLQKVRQELQGKGRKGSSKKRGVDGGGGKEEDGTEGEGEVEAGGGGGGKINGKSDGDDADGADEAEAPDEGEPVGDIGKADDGLVKVKVGRGLGVGELVERVEIPRN